MKKTLFIIIALVIGFAFSSCEKKITTNDVTTKIADLPILTLKGDATMVLTVGDTYTDPGVSALAGTTELDVTTTGTVNTAVAGQYILTYTSTTTEGFSADVSRTVWVVPPAGDFVTSIAGYYLSSVTRVSNGETYNNLQYVLIVPTGNANEYTLSHGIGGFYAMGRNYGPDYASVGEKFTYDFTTFTEISGGTFPIWGNVTSVSGFAIDAGTKTITFTGTGNFGNGVFDITLTQQ